MAITSTSSKLSRKASRGIEERPIEVGSSSSSESSESDSEDEISQDYLDSLLEKARQNLASKKNSTSSTAHGQTEEEEVIRVGDGDDNTRPLPPLDPGNLPAPYMTLSDEHRAGPSKLRDPDVERAEKMTSTLVTPAALLPPPELSKSGKPITKKEKRAMKNKTAGPGWFDLPSPAEADLPRLYREVESLRLHNQLDPKRFYRKDEGEGKGIKGLPKHFAIGTILPSNTPFGGPSADNLTRSSRKRTLVDELVDDAEAKSYAKKKFKELQSVRGAKGRGTLAQKNALRKQKW